MQWEESGNWDGAEQDSPLHLCYFDFEPMWIITCQRKLSWKESSPPQLRLFGGIVD